MITLSFTSGSLFVIATALSSNSVVASPIVSKMAQASIQVVRYVENGKRLDAAQGTVRTDAAKEIVSRSVVVRPCNPHPNSNTENNGEKRCQLLLTETY
jgi:hypothetical protein